MTGLPCVLSELTPLRWWWGEGEGQRERVRGCKPGPSCWMQPTDAVLGEAGPVHPIAPNPAELFNWDPCSAGLAGLHRSLLHCVSYTARQTSESLSPGFGPRSPVRTADTQRGRADQHRLWTGCVVTDTTGVAMGLGLVGRTTLAVGELVTSAQSWRPLSEGHCAWVLSPPPSFSFIALGSPFMDTHDLGDSPGCSIGQKKSGREVWGEAWGWPQGATRGRRRVRVRDCPAC